MIEPSIGVNPVAPGWPGFVSVHPYGLLSLITPPASEPVTTAQLKKHLRVDDADSDDYIVDLGTLAREWAERDTERAFITQTWTLLLDSFPWWRAPIMLPKPPLQSVVSVKYYDQDDVLQTWDPSNYVVVAPAGPTAQRGQVMPASGVSYPSLGSAVLARRRPDSVQVQFICGWTSAALVPVSLKQAMYLIVGNLYQNREAAQIIRGSADVLPFGAEALLAPYRVLVY